MKRRDFVTRIIVAGGALSMGVGCGRKIEGDKNDRGTTGNNREEDNGKKHEEEKRRKEKTREEIKGKLL